MNIQHAVEKRGRRSAGDDARRRLMAGIPVRERRLQLAGVSTTVLEGGDGPPAVLLHDPGEYAAKWMQVIPALVTTLPSNSLKRFCVHCVPRSKP